MAAGLPVAVETAAVAAVVASAGKLFQTGGSDCFRPLIAFILSTTCAFAQTPAPSNSYGRDFPQIHPDRRVTFKINIPNAKTVAVAGRASDSGMNGAKPYPMTKGPDGQWSVTTDPVRPGFHYYQLIVDGIAANDPMSETYFGWAQPTSGLEVPDPELSFYDLTNVPHGNTVIHAYRTRDGAFRQAYIYTPPNYQTNLRARYPVLYLQHGSGEDERGWTRQGKANWILDNLIAAGKAKPMIVVMEKGYVGKPGPGASEAFTKLVVEELVPEIDRAFRTAANRDNRAIAGLSMGAGQAAQIGLTNPDKFAYIGIFSGGARNLKDLTAVDKSNRLLWIGCGAEDRAFEGLKAIHESLDTRHVKHVWFEGPGSHEWQVWRKHLHAFAPLLFSK